MSISCLLILTRVTGQVYNFQFKKRCYIGFENDFIKNQIRNSEFSRADDNKNEEASADCACEICKFFLQCSKYIKIEGLCLKIVF